MVRKKLRTNNPPPSRLPEQPEYTITRWQKKDRIPNWRKHRINPQSSYYRSPGPQKSGRDQPPRTGRGLFFLASYFLINLMLYHSVLLSLLEEYPPALYHFWLLK